MLFRSLEHATTGDGVLTALSIADLVKRSGRPLADLAAVVTRLPQVLINVPGVDKSKVAHVDISSAVAHAEQQLGDSGRVLLRPSGTEPLIRVMVEATTQAQAQEVAQRLADVVQSVCAL